MTEADRIAFCFDNEEDRMVTEDGLYIQDVCHDLSIHRHVFLEPLTTVYVFSDASKIVVLDDRWQVL